MSDKFPEIDTPKSNGDFEDSSDFLSREKELVGDEFTTDQDKKVLQDSEDEEINEFKEQFPEVEGTESQQQSQQQSQQNEEFEDEIEFEGFESTQPSKDLSQSTSIKEWKQRRDLEIEEREKINSQKKKDIINKAKTTIDDFYENYNSKKENNFKIIAKDQEQFLNKRDNFLKNGTLWDRVNELISKVDNIVIDDSRDKTRFKEILTKLKGKENVPGAGGYAQE
ncbi:clc1 [Candida pseudojiufengensis]|uniref:clc1 n=1 Tax=Candida pseudojiufengensis TaxID=497109 RepID=UPI0022244467|nr:clc1 [Candida pseudojiufengensis]KAI5965773.1 clc1 [Candida pseudojiufengensis]